jgi:alkylated DNA nucleotide flippase Atl1
MLTEAAEVTRGVRGPAWWVLPDGRDLPTAAGATQSGRGFDWSQLHAAMSAIPPGRWTTCGDLANLVGTAAQPLVNHIAGCPECPNAQRVLGADGRARPNFAWSDPNERRRPEDILQEEGVRIHNGTADPSHRLTATELEALAEGTA